MIPLFRFQYGNNCYAYALNNLNPARTKYDKPQPGAISNLPQFDTNKTVDENYTIVRTALIGDGKGLITETTRDEATPHAFYKMALCIGPDDFHYYRQDPIEQGGFWSQKHGGSLCTDWDAGNAIITDPEKANSLYGKGVNYTKFGGYFSVPADKPVDICGNRGK